MHVLVFICHSESVKKDSVQTQHCYTLQLYVFHLVCMASVWNLVFVDVTLDGQEVNAMNVRLLHISAYTVYLT